MRLAGALEGLDVSVAPQLLTRGESARGCAEGRSSPAAPTARHIRHVATIQVHPDIDRHTGETSIEQATGNIPLVFAR